MPDTVSLKMVDHFGELLISAETSEAVNFSALLESHLRQGKVTLDFAGTKPLMPAFFINQVFGPLMEHMSDTEFMEKVTFNNAWPHITDQMLSCLPFARRYFTEPEYRAKIERVISSYDEYCSEN